MAIQTIFHLQGDRGDYMSLDLEEIYDYPERTSFEGGYDIRCVLRIHADVYDVQAEYYTATGPLYQFQQELKQCWETLQGTANFRMALEADLEIQIQMQQYGHARVKGSYWHRYSENKLEFVVDTDQTCLRQVIIGIEELKQNYPGISM